jgi:hypothetical protein
MKILSAFLWSLLAISPSFAGGDYPLTMTAVFTKGQMSNSHDTSKMYHAGDYDCTRGDENNAPECHTLLEWANLDAIGGTPDTVVFTLADGSQVGVQTVTIHKVPGFAECRPSSSYIFCSLYYELLSHHQVGEGKTATVNFRYKLHGGPKNGVQRIEVDKSSCVTEQGTNFCTPALEVLNPRGNSYVVGVKVQLPAAAATAPQPSPHAAPPPPNSAELETARQNSEDAKTSPAAAAAMATTGHASTPQELAALVAKGQASRCAVITNPAGAEVYIDGNKGGVSPLVFVLLKQGDTPRTVTIKMAGYKTVEKQFVPDGKIIPISVTLEKDVH